MFFTTRNKMINVKTNWRIGAEILIICFLVRKINAWTSGKTSKYTFPVWQHMIWLWVCTHCCLFHVICFGVNMTPMWHDFILICFIYAIYFPPRTSVLSILADILYFLKEQPRHDSNDECILLADMQHSYPNITLYLDDIFKIGVAIANIM